MSPALPLALAFFMGAFPTAYLAGRYFGKLDIRQHGSGNVGATNAFRVLGKGPGIIVFAVDFAKGCLAPAFLPRIFSLPEGVIFWLAAAVILGHIFNPFLKFKGGKGVATGAGALAALDPQVFMGALAVWILLFVGTRTVSISSLVALLSAFIFAFFLRLPAAYLIFLGLGSALIIWTHRENIERLKRGSEKKF